MTRELKRGQVLRRSLQSIVGKIEIPLVAPLICEGWLFAPRLGRHLRGANSVPEIENP